MVVCESESCCGYSLSRAPSSVPRRRSLLPLRCLVTHQLKFKVLALGCQSDLTDTLTQQTRS